MMKSGGQDWWTTGQFAVLIHGGLVATAIAHLPRLHDSMNS